MRFDLAPRSATGRGRRAAAALVVVLVTAAADADAAPRAVVVGSAHVDAGEVEPGQVQKFDFKLENAGDAVLSIESIEPTCYCTTGKAEAWSIPPGGSTQVHVVVDPSDWVGEIVKGVEVETNDPENQHVLLDAKMTVRPGIAVVPPEIDFGAVPAAGSKALTVDIKAPKTRPFKITALTADVPWVTATEEPLQTDDRMGVKVFARVASGAPAGPFTTKIVVLTDDAGKPRIEIPVRGSGPGGLQVQPERLLFETASAGAGVGTITVRGGAGKKVELTAVKPSSPAVEATLHPQADGSYQVEVRIAKAAKPGRVLAKLVIATTDTAQPELTIPVMGVVK
jgi:hypothetical protein